MDCRGRSQMNSVVAYLVIAMICLMIIAGVIL